MFSCVSFDRCSLKFFSYTISDFSLHSGSHHPKQSSDCCCAYKCFCCPGVCCRRGTSPQNYLEEGWGYFYCKQYKVLYRSQHEYSSLLFKNILITESLIRHLRLVKVVLFSQIRTNLCTVFSIDPNVEITVVETVI